MPAISITDFHTSKQYLALTPKQRVWVDTFVQTQDALQATKTAYASATEESARTLTYAVRANYRVRAAVNCALGRAEQEIFLEEVQRDIDHAPVGSDRRVRALAMYARLKFGDAEPAAAPEKQTPQPDSAPTPAPQGSKVFHVGQRVTQRRKDGSLRDGVVAEVDAHGRATKIEDAPR